MILSKKYSNVATTILFVVLISALGGCKSEKTEDTEAVQEVTDSVPASQSIQKIFYSIPSPIQAASLLKKSGAAYSKELMNPAKNESKYSTNFRKSINMGIYGADLAYCNMYNHTQEAIAYLNIVNKLGNSIGLTGVIEKAGILGRFQENLGNKDSLMLILSDLFQQSDEYLKENQQLNTATIVLAGGWFEALYIAAAQNKKTAKPELKQLIAEQKLSLVGLMSMLPETESDVELGEFKNMLKDLKVSYDNISLDRGEAQISTDEKTKMTTVSGNNTISVKDELLNEITEKIIASRNKLVN